MILKNSIKNTVSHFSASIFFLCLTPFIWFFTGSFIILLTVFTGFLLDLFSIPIFKQYNKINSNLIVDLSANSIIIKNNEQLSVQRHHEEISKIILHRPKANIGGMAMGEFKYFLIEYNDGMYLPITSLMFGDKINDVLKLLPLDKIHEINEYYCLIKGFEKLNSTNCFQ